MSELSFVRTEMLPERAPPASSVGVICPWLTLGNPMQPTVLVYTMRLHPAA